jgi:hypothetical protein
MPIAKKWHVYQKIDLSIIEYKSLEALYVSLMGQENLKCLDRRCTASGFYGRTVHPQVGGMRK